MKVKARATDRLERPAPFRFRRTCLQLTGHACADRARQGDLRTAAYRQAEERRTSRLIHLLVALGLLACPACAVGSAADPITVPTSAITDARPRTELLGGLIRRSSRPLEDHGSTRTVYGSFVTRAGFRVRTIQTLPSGFRRAPAVLFVQWLSCDSVEADPRDQSGWTEVIRGLVETPGLIVMRTEKPGVGDSQGPACDRLDYDTELAVHRQALDRLMRDPRVDRHRVFVIGMSMGSNMAPLIAAGRPVAGLAIWGGGADNWLKRQLAFEQSAMILSGFDPTQRTRRSRKTEEFYRYYLGEGLTPTEIARRRPDLDDVWPRWVVGAEGNTHFGRPFAFHQQAQRHDWVGAWAKVTAPTLVLMGGNDWYEDVGSARKVTSIVKRRGVARARLAVIPGLDHHFVRFPNRAAAFRQKGGQADTAAVVTLLRAFVSDPAKTIASPDLPISAR